ncbi:MAG: tetratricopeptide repeat protein [Gemmataceae bacterium]
MSVESIFAAASQKPSVERSAYLDNACGTNSELRRKVERLLAAHDAAGDFLEPPSPGATQDYTPIDSEPGQIIGPYKLLQSLGEGGMGTVWVVEQEQPVKRRVALKLIKAGMDSTQVLRRFEAERQALALMDHTNIAKVLDAGTTPQGRPYFAMELVKGVPITKYCDELHLSLRERLDLFVPVCRAIQHAHQKGIIHRDIKPSNVLVAVQDGKPVPKVIDFGVAKAMQQRLTEQSMYTEIGAVIGTLEYMSPEQAELSALDIDTRTDVYALGVLLYELLTGSTPLDRKRLKEAAFAEMLRIIKEVEPPKPSTRLTDLQDSLATLAAQRRTEPGKLTKAMRGELDWIVMKCLEKDRTRRYETANGLGRDIERYLSDEPVEAGPPSAAYKVRKFVRRHQVAIYTASAFVVTIFILGTLSLCFAIMSLRAENEAKFGRARAAQAEIKAKASEQKALAAAETEKKSKEDAQAREADTKAVLKFVEDQVFAAARPENLGREVTLKRAVEEALPKITDGFKDRPLIEACLHTTIGKSFMDLGDLAMAEVQFRRARDLFTAELGPDHLSTLITMNHFVRSQYALAKFAEALAFGEETLRLCQAKLGPDHPETLLSLESLANIYSAIGRDQKALTFSAEVLKRRKATFGPNHPDTLGSMSNLAVSYSALGRHVEALALREETARLQKVNLGPDHADTLRSMLNLANSYKALGRHADALALQKETLKSLTIRLGPDHPDTLICMNNFANSYAALGRHTEAIELRAETFKRQKLKLDPDHPDTIQSMGNLVLSYFDLGRNDEALPVLDEAVSRAAGKLGVHPQLITWLMVCRLRIFEGRHDPAGCQATAEMWENLKGTDAASLYQAAWNRAVCAAVILGAKPVAVDAIRLARVQTDQAMVLLKQAVAAGYKDVQSMKTDKDFDSLRDREDFKKLIAELEAKTP